MTVAGQLAASVTTTANDRAISGVNTNTSGTNYGGVFIGSGVGATAHTGGYFNAAGATTNYGVRIAGPASGANNYAIYADAAAQSYFAGNVGIGTTTPGAPLTVSSSTTLSAGDPSIVLQGVSNTERLHIRSALGAAAGQPVMLLAAARGTIASPTAVQDGDDLGFYQLGGYNGTTYRRGAWINGKAEGAHSATSSGAAILFQTTENGSVAIAERMRITGSGNVGIGTTSPGKKLDLVGQFRASNAAASGYALMEYGTSATATNNWHVGSEGDGTFRWYNGTFGAGTEYMRLSSTGLAVTGALSATGAVSVTSNLGIAFNTFGNVIKRLDADGALQITSGQSNINLTPATNVIVTQGSVGIGGAPGTNAKLAVIGGAIGINSASFTADASLHIATIYGGNGRLTQMHPTGNSLNALNLMGSTNGAGGVAWWSWGVNAGNWTINPGTSFGTGFTINSSGNVGIGTTSPASKLQVTTSGAAALPPTSGTTPSTGELIRLRTSSDAAGGIGTIGLSTNQMWLQACDATNLGAYYQLLLNPNGGNVGIGTTSTSYKLDVNGNIYSINNAYNATHGYAGKFIDNTNAAGNLVPFSFENTYPNHSYGIVARFRTNGTGDRPSIQFSSGASNNRWNVGYCFGDDNFRITQNMAFDNSGNNGDWGLERFRINTDGVTFSFIDFRAPIYYDLNDTTYYINPGSNSVLFGQIDHTGAHGSTRIFNTLPAAQNGAGTGIASMLWWVSEPGVTWTEGGFGYNVINDGGSPSGFSRSNTAFGQAYMRFTQDGTLYFYNTNTAGTRVTSGYWANGGNLISNIDTRSPIFYDLNDTGYYVNPNSTSQFSLIQANNYIFCNNQIYATLMYDSNDYGYYCDPTNESNMGRVTLGGSRADAIRSTGYNGYGNTHWGLGVASGYVGLNITLLTGSSYSPIDANNSGGGTIFRANEYGTVTCVSLVQTSDGRYKDVINEFELGLDAILGLRPVRFHWNEKSTLRRDIAYTGFIAQEVETVIPEAVHYDQKDDRYSLEERPIIAALVNAIKELNERIKTLESKS